MASKLLFCSAVLLLVAAGDACFQRMGSQATEYNHKHGFIDAIDGGGSSRKLLAEGPAPYDWAVFGRDWPGTCATGMRQSPVDVGDVKSIPVLDSNHQRTTWSYSPLVSNGSNVEVISNGNYLQVEWLHEYTSDVRVATPEDMPDAVVADVLNSGKPVARGYGSRVKATPVQFHFHYGSENWVAGQQYPLEMHIVHTISEADMPGCGAVGGSCFVAVGILFKVGNKRSDFLDTILKTAPTTKGRALLPAGSFLDLGSIVPPGAPYVTFEGGLTVPPCFEGILWHVLTEPEEMTFDQLMTYLEVTGEKAAGSGPSSPAIKYGVTARLPQPLNGRVMRRVERAKKYRVANKYYSDDGDSDTVF